MKIWFRALCVFLLSGLGPGRAFADNDGPTAAASTAESRSERTAYNSLYVEAFGNAIFDSLNYDRMFGEHWSARVGIGYMVVNSRSYEFVPVMGNYLVGEGSHKLELGLGAMLAIGPTGESKSVAGTDKAIGVTGTATVGYRYAPQHGGIHFKVGFTPIFGAGGLLPSAGISFGGIFGS